MKSKRSKPTPRVLKQYTYMGLDSCTPIVKSGQQLLSEYGENMMKRMQELSSGHITEDECLKWICILLQAEEVLA